jgi:hypothetical protein
MVGGSWLNADNLFLQFGTQKAVPEIAGEFLSYGQTRDIEALIDLTSTNANQYWSTATSPPAFAVTNAANSPLIVTNTEFFPANVTGANKLFIESVEVITLTGMTVGSGATGISIGLISGVDRATIASGGSTALVNALANASFTTTGQKVILTTGSTSAGGYIGNPTTNFTVPQLLTLTTIGGTGTYSAGLIKVRVKYNMYGTITQ